VLKQGRQTGESYKKQCLHKLVAELKAVGRMDSSILQFDGDRTHGTAAARHYLESKGLKVLPKWPPRSPDLSPIENIWAILQTAVDRGGPRQGEELAEFVMAEWGKIPTSVMNNCVESFRGRCTKCVEVDGVTIETRGSRKRGRST
jgi:hypothetical protein